MDILTKSGSISAYGFACGYVERKANGTTGLWKKMYKEHNVFHVRSNVKDVEWKSFDTLKDAKKAYKEININGLNAKSKFRLEQLEKWVERGTVLMKEEQLELANLRNESK